MRIAPVFSFGNPYSERVCVASCVILCSINAFLRRTKTYCWPDLPPPLDDVLFVCPVPAILSEATASGYDLRTCPKRPVAVCLKRKIREFSGKNLEIRIFCLPLHSQSSNAEIAQLVERNLAKVEVAGPSPVFRSRGGQKETPTESKKPCMSAICKAFSCISPLLLKQKAASISVLHRDLFCPDRKQTAI